MTQIKPMTAGLALGAFAVLWHAIWSALVAVGWAQSVLDFVFRLHFITPPLHVAPFDLVTAALLVAITGVGGFVIGALLAAIWNSAVRRA